MTLFMFLKSLHFFGMTLWIGGMCMLGVVMNAWRRAPDSAGLIAFINAVQRWNQRVVLPAMILTWLTGIGMTLMGSWPPSASLLVKGLFVLMLSALHGMQSGALRRGLAQNRLAAPRLLNYACGFTVLALVVSVVLIVVRPF
ncbi:hypothetical protein SODG_006690 [Sodalis praecaptivus]|uniref:CopD family protein n=1 Tax=Sodalis praecaptivus TaxID=1239307 RepID=UPI0027F3EAF0|nr:CopD family protein [Sodalis praecaptivus]CAJ0994095.1 hypothetical protein NVIRENTERO_01250 [Sodalis praecaptivus]